MYLFQKWVGGQSTVYVVEIFGWPPTHLFLFTQLLTDSPFFAGQQYCWSDTASCISETASTTILPNHLRSTDITSSKTRPTSGNLETASAVASASAVGRKSYNNLKTTHYGLIDWPSPKAVLATSNEKREVFLKNWINRLGLLIESAYFLCF